MTTPIETSRRGFLRGAAMAAGAVAIGAPAHAAEPITRTGGPHMKLSLAAYSFNRQLQRRPTPTQLKEAEMTLEDFVDFCAAMNLDGCEPTSYYFPKELDHDYLMALKQKTFRLGLDISGTAIGNDYCIPPSRARERQLDDTRAWIDHAAALGAPVIRIFAGKAKPGMTEEEALDLCVAGIDEALEYAATKGVFLALENHGGITATPEQLLRIVQRVKPSPWFGVNFDSGNFKTADPYADLAKIAPYTLNAQIKVMMRHENGKTRADFGRIIGILGDAGYRGYIVLEYEEKDDPREAIPPLIEELRGLIRG
ncbi:MAG: sugar phosphate isomerase/epimerase family protein [Candidatus Hydrogenedentota bacterium]